MKINKNTWHYKLVSSDKEIPTTLCGYFWSVVGNCLLMGFGFIILGFLTFFLLSPIWAPLYQSYVNADFDLSIAKAAGCFEFIVAVIAGICYLRNKSSFVRVIFEYIGALKKQMCPLIEYVEDSNEHKNS